jgi:TrmH family RNA methyltransferase
MLLKKKIVLVGIEGEINMGFILRLARNFKAENVVLVQPKISDMDVVRRFSAKAESLVQRILIVDNMEEAFESEEFRVCTSSKSGGKGDVLRQSVSVERLPEILEGKGKVALVFGRESTGLTRRELEYCDIIATIPASPEYPVLNLSHAVAIVLYKIYVFEKGLRFEIGKSADREKLMNILKVYSDIIERVVEDENKRRRLSTAFKKILYKSNATETEASLLEYGFRKILRRLSECFS